MKSLEDVKKGLECCFQYKMCVGCPYFDSADTEGRCVVKLGTDALLHMIRLESMKGERN